VNALAELLELDQEVFDPIALIPAGSAFVYRTVEDWCRVEDARGDSANYRQGQAAVGELLPEVRTRERQRVRYEARAAERYRLRQIEIEEHEAKLRTEEKLVRQERLRKPPEEPEYPGDEDNPFDKVKDPIGYYGFREDVIRRINKSFLSEWKQYLYWKRRYGVIDARPKWGIE